MPDNTSALATLIRRGFRPRQALGLLEAFQQAAPTGGGGGGAPSGGSFGGSLHVRSAAHDYNFSSPSHSYRAKSYTFDNPYGQPAAFALSAAGDPNAFGTSVSGWYHVRSKVAARFEPTAYPAAVSFQGTGYYGDTKKASYAVALKGGDDSYYAGVQIDTSHVVWIPALGVDGDDSGYFYGRLDWQNDTEAPLVGFGGGNLFFEFFITLLAAT